MTDTVGKSFQKDPEVVEKASRRRFTDQYKRQIALEAEQCTQPGEIGALLRREGIYSSVLARWRRQLRQESSMSPPKKRRSKKTSSAREIEDLRRENERLKEKPLPS